MRYDQRDDKRNDSEYAELDPEQGTFGVRVHWELLVCC